MKIKCPVCGHIMRCQHPGGGAVQTRAATASLHEKLRGEAPPMTMATVPRAQGAAEPTAWRFVMRDAARALDDVSDHLGEVMRRADQLLAEWSGFGAQVRAQVEREVAGIGAAVDGAVVRAAGAGLDRAIADRLRALTVELERLEQRSRAAARAVAERRDADRRVLWVVVAGIVLANALLVMLLLRKPTPAPAAEPIRVESRAVPWPAEPSTAAPAVPAGEASAAGDGIASEGSAAGVAPASAGTIGSAAGASAGSATSGSNAGPGASAGSSVPPTKAGSGAQSGAPAKSAPANAPRSVDAAGTRTNASPIALPPKAGSRPHKKLP